MKNFAAAVFLAFARNSCAASDCKLSDFGTLPVEMTGEQATTIVKVNGKDTRFILDTGASFNSMSKANADTLQLRREAPPFELRGIGIGGSFSLQLTKIKEFGVLGQNLRNIEFLVGGSDLGMPLIGANLLDLADLDIDLAHGKLRMMKPEGRGCDRLAMAYWTKGGDFQVAELRRSGDPNDSRSFVTVLINGKPVKALFDTGAYATLLARRAAESVGVDLNSPSVKSSYITRGLGTKSYKSWTAPIDTFSVGTETIQRSKMQVIDGDLSGDAEMLLGVDFFLAHHLFIANSQRKIYFTYNGGRVFTFAKSHGDSDQSTISPGDDKDTPKTADEYARRGQAHLSRGESVAALADLDNAVHLAPDVAANHLARAHAHLTLDQPDAAAADLDKSLELDPTNVEALLLRARQRLDREDRAGAKADIEAARHLGAAASGQGRAIAALYIEVDQPDAALPLLDAWIRLHGNDASLSSALNERCWARGLANQMLNDALDDCHEAIKRDGQNPAYLDSLGLVELRLKNYPAAIQAYQQVVAERPGMAWSRYGLGLAKIRSGRVDDGNADLAAAKTLEPKIGERFALFDL
jgi:predicted aspartyl protease